MSLPWPLLLVLVWERVGGTADGDLVLGLIGAARMLPYVAFSWATARLADALRRDLIVRVTLVVRALLLLAGAVAVVESRVWLAVAACTLTVAVGTPAYPAQVAAMAGVAGLRRRRATDVLVTVEVAVPSKLSAEERAAVEALAEATTESPRAHLGAATTASTAGAGTG